MTMRITKYADFELWHEVERLGPGVAENVVRLIQQYARQASLTELPPISLLESGWDAPWETITTVEPCSGNAGPGDEELKHGATMYRCLSISLPNERQKQHYASYPLVRSHPATIEGTIAHEIVHLRWRPLQHGLEFDARVNALLRGATFPPHSSWSRGTRRIMAETRQEMKECLAKLLNGKER